MEHWLPLFHERLETLFDYLPDAVVTFDPLDDDARAKRLEQIKDHYEAREQALERKAFGAPPYNPVPPESLFFTENDWRKALQGRQRIVLDPFEHPDAARDATVVSFGGRQGRSFVAERQREGGNVFDAVVAHAGRLQSDGKRVLVACWSKGAKERLATLLAEHGIGDTLRVETWQEVLAAPQAATAFAVLAWRLGSRRRASPSSASRTSSATGWCAAPGQRAAATCSPRFRASPSATSWFMPITALAVSPASPPSKPPASRMIASK